MNCNDTVTAAAAHPASSITCNVTTHIPDEARRFLCLLDPGARDFTFQTFDEHRMNGSLARSTSDRAEILQLYRMGAGVYVTVNETDLTGRKSESIKRIRAC